VERRRKGQSPGLQGPGPSTDIHDSNGLGRWSREGIFARYRELCRELRLEPATDLRPLEQTKGDVRWVHPILDKVIQGIDAGDAACIGIGLDLIEEDEHLPFGKTLKSNTARALRRAPLTKGQSARIRKRVVAMLLAGNVPHEFKQYVKLLRTVGVGDLWPEIDDNVRRDNPYVMRWYTYLQKTARGAAPQRDGDTDARPGGRDGSWK
jgi:hypothetical protein